MREITISLGPAFDAGDYLAVKAAAASLKPGDHLVVTLEAADAHEADTVLGLLKAAELDYQIHGSHTGLTIHIVATPREKPH